MTPALLSARLGAAAQFVDTDLHADIGSDHALLPIALVRSERARRVVIVEKNPGPLHNAQEAVRRAGLVAHIDVRAGDGFAPLAPGEVESASMTGMGARTMLGVLARAGDALPPHLILQPNDTAAPLREWAAAHSFHVAGEALPDTQDFFPVVSLRRADGPDPAYEDVPRDLGLAFGPRLLRARDARLIRSLQDQRARLDHAARFSRPDVLRDLDLVARALAWFD